MDIKQKIKLRRTELGMTMLEVAKKVGVSEATISRWESGDIANMRRDKIVSLANALQVPPSFIMEWEPEDDTTLMGYDVPKEKEQLEHEPLLSEKQKSAFQLLLRVTNEKNLDRLIDFLQLLIQAENQ